MFKIRFVLILGIWIALLPYLGFPILIKNILFSLTGLALIYLSLVLYKKRKKIRLLDKKNQTFKNEDEDNKSDLLNQNDN